MQKINVIVCTSRLLVLNFGPYDDGFIAGKYGHVGSIVRSSYLTFGSVFILYYHAISCLLIESAGLVLQHIA